MATNPRLVPLEPGHPPVPIPQTAAICSKRAALVDQIVKDAKRNDPEPKRRDRTRRAT